MIIDWQEARGPAAMVGDLTGYVNGAKKWRISDVGVRYALSKWNGTDWVRQGEPHGQFPDAQADAERREREG